MKTNAHREGGKKHCGKKGNRAVKDKTIGGRKDNSEGKRNYNKGEKQLVKRNKVVKEIKTV